MRNEKVKKVMNELKAGALRSGSGAKVVKRKQAVAIGLSEERTKDQQAKTERRLKGKPV